MSKTLKINLVIFLTSYCLALQFVVTPILGNIQKEFSSVSISTTQMLVTVPMLLGAIFALASGLLVRFISKKTLMLLASLICWITGMIPLFFGGFLTLFISRIILGIGLGALTALSASVIADSFEGKKRISAMGLQAASIGGSILLITTLSGFLGNTNYRLSLLVHFPALFAFFAIFFLLEDRGKEVILNSMPFSIDKRLSSLVILSAVEFLFIVSFSTNIAMHITGNLSGNTKIVGGITGIFAASQILAGLLLNKISRYARSYTLSLAMLCFFISASILIFTSNNLFLIVIAAVFAGLSQGIFVPRAMFEAAECVPKEATALAAALVSTGISAGQFTSPIILNSIAKLIYGHIQTTYVFSIGAVIMWIIPFIMILKQKTRKTLEAASSK